MTLYLPQTGKDAYARAKLNMLEVQVGVPQPVGGGGLETVGVVGIVIVVIIVIILLAVIAVVIAIFW